MKTGMLIVLGIVVLTGCATATPPITPPAPSPVPAMPSTVPASAIATPRATLAPASLVPRATPPITPLAPSPAPAMPSTVPASAIATLRATLAPASLVPRATPPIQTVGSVIIRPILIERIQVLELETAPVQYRVLAFGILSDPCTRFHRAEKSQIGNTIVITLTSARQAEVMCIQITQPFQHTIALGTLAPGKYVVRVNGVEQTFTAR